MATFSPHSLAFKAGINLSYIAGMIVNNYIIQSYNLVHICADEIWFRYVYEYGFMCMRLVSDVHDCSNCQQLLVMDKHSLPHVLHKCSCRTHSCSIVLMYQHTYLILETLAQLFHGSCPHGRIGMMDTQHQRATWTTTITKDLVSGLR